MNYVSKLENPASKSEINRLAHCAFIGEATGVAHDCTVPLPSRESLDPEKWKSLSNKRNPVKEVAERKIGMEVCERCGSRYTTHTSAQTRGADEPTTIFYVCTECEHRWKE